jgi:glutamine amidotransferase
MTVAVTIIDYGIGNLFSVARAIEAVGGTPRLASTYQEVRDADRILLPGVGAFEPCIRTLTEMGLTDAVKAFAESERPFLGICVGMQLLFDYSLEFGRHDGLGLVRGHVGAIPEKDAKGDRKVPHIGWTPLLKPNGVKNWDGTVLEGCEAERTSFYFVHSYNCLPSDPASLLAQADYAGYPICAAIRQNNVTAFQCHPEKSGKAGLNVLARFLGQ